MAIEFEDKSKKRMLTRAMFPNYLLHQAGEENSEAKEQIETTYIDEALKEATPAIPFLRQNREGIRRGPKEETTMVERNYFKQEQKRFEKEKRTAEQAKRWDTFGATHPSRRPFRQTEFPSLWGKKESSHDSTDYRKLKASLTVPMDHLIHFDFNQQEPAQTKRVAPKKGLHRSLSNIMEQEKVKSDWVDRQPLMIQ